MYYFHIVLVEELPKDGIGLYNGEIKEDINYCKYLL